MILMMSNEKTAWTMKEDVDYQKETAKFKAVLQGISKFRDPSIPRLIFGKGSKNMGQNT